MLNSPALLLAVRVVHTAIYVVMAVSTFVVLYAGISGAQGPWLFVALGLLGIESVVFAGSGMRCPLTGLAAKYGAKSGHDTVLPERITRHTFRFFGAVMAAGLLLLGARWLGILRWPG